MIYRVRFWTFILTFLISVLGGNWENVYGEYCPDCVDHSNVTCKPWGYGQAKFLWTSEENPSSDITLTAGPCGQAGETGIANIFSYIDVHSAVCNENSPCGGDIANYGAFAIIRISGNQKAFEHIFPSGLLFGGNHIVQADPDYYAGTVVTKTGCDYQLSVGGPPAMKIRLQATVVQCQPEFNNSKFGINITFYQKRSEDPDSFSMLARARGSITVKANKKTNCDPISFRPDLRDGSSIAWIEELPRAYSAGGDSDWEISYKALDWEQECITEEGWLGPECLDYPTGCLIGDSETHYRVKYPTYKKDAYGTPGYAAMDGWSYNYTNKYVALKLGDQGTIYYHCNKKSGNKYMLSSIERCGVGVNPGNGDTEWMFRYDGGGKLIYAYNEDNPVGDPNSLQGTKCYSYDWTGNAAEVTYQSRPDTGSSWGTDRQWEVEFDEEDRAIKYDASCTGGCGSGSGEFEHIEYHDTYDNLIVKRFNAQGQTILENTYDQLIYGDYEPAFWIWVSNYSFEYDDVTTGFCQSSLVPTDWTRTAGLLSDVSICDPNSTVPDGEQVLRLEGAVTLEQQTWDYIWEETIYTLEASVQAIPGGAASTADISLYTSTDTSRENPLVTVTFIEGVDANEGEWALVGDVWDSGDYQGNIGSDQFIVEINGYLVDIDDVRLTVSARIYNRSKPILTLQKVYDDNLEQLVPSRQWTYDQNTRIVLEKNWIDASDYMVTEYEYADDAFSQLAEKTEYGTLSDNPSDPSGSSYSTVYDSNDVTYTYITEYPNGKRADVQRYNEQRLLVESYVWDTVADVNTLVERFEYVELVSPNLRWEVQKHTSPRGGITEYSYKKYGSGATQTARHLLESQIYPETTAGQQEVWYNYDGAQRILSEKRKDTNSDWITTGYNYDPITGNLASVIRNGNGIYSRTEYKYNDFGQVTRQIDPDKVATGKSYGLGGELVSEFIISASSDPNDSDTQLTLISQTRYEYDSNSRLEKVKRAIDDEEFTYDEPDDWAVTKYEYNSLGQKIKMIEDYDALGLRMNMETLYGYDRQGRLSKTTYPSGRWVTILRDGRGLVTNEIVGYNQTEVYETAYDYDDNGNLIEQINPDGTVLIHTYDNFDRLEKTYKYSSSGPYTLRQYDTAGSVILEQAFDPNDVIFQDIRKEYDVLSNLFLERIVVVPNSPDNTNDLISTHAYDVAGNLRRTIRKGVGSVDPNGMIETNDEVVDIFYDPLNRKVMTIDPEGVYSTYTYSDAGRLLESIDPNIPDPNQLFVTVHIYDEAGRLNQTTNPEGDYTVFSYNSLNQLIKQVVWDCNSTMDYTSDDVPVRQVRYAYNRLGKRTREVIMEDPASTATEDVAIDQVTDWIYDPNSGLLDETRTYYGTGGTAAITKYYYDQIGRNWRTVDPEGNETREYYDTTNGVQVVKRQQMEKDPADSNNDYTVTVFFDYDDDGNLYKRTLDEDGDETKEVSDTATWYYYDDLDRLEKQVGPDGVATFYEYDSFGNVSKTIEDYDAGNSEALNKTTETVFDRLNRQIKVIAYDPNDTTTHVAEQITEYEYNKRGQVNKIIYPDSTYIQYLYNDLRQVDEEVRRDGSSIFYWYDRLGNVVAESDDEDLIDPTFLTEYDFDAAGNLLWCIKEEDGQTITESAFVYNGLGLPESETTTLYDLDPKTTTFTYDGSGNVLMQTHNNETFTFAHDGLGRIETIDRGEDQIVAYSYIGTATKAIDYTEADTTWNAYYDKLGRITECVTIDPNSDTLLDLFYTYDENSNRDSVQYKHIAPNVWDIYTYNNLQRLIKAEYGSSSGLAQLDDYIGDVQFAATVGSRWLISQESFLLLAQMQVKEIRDRQKQVHQALVKTGLDEVVKKANGGQMPVVALADFGESSDKKDESTYQMLRNDDGKVVAIVILDAEGRIILLTLYPEIGGTVIVSVTYDKKDNITSKICSTYGTNGVLIDQIDLLALDQQQTLLASSKTASSKRGIPATSSVTSQSIDTGLDGGMVLMSMSTPEGPAPLTEEFEYDHLGNRVEYTGKASSTMNYTHNVLNQYNHLHHEAPLGLYKDYYPSYDTNGNLSEDSYGWEYAYDYRNRLVEVEDSNSSTMVEFGYDALGRRVMKQDIEEGITTYFYYDLFDRVIAEYEKPSGGSTAWARSFVYGNGIDEVLGMFLPEHTGDPDDLTALREFVAAWLSEENDANWDETYDYTEDNIIDFNDFTYYASVWDVPDGKETRFYYLKDALGSTIGLVGGRYQRESDREFYLYDVYGQPTDSSLPSAAGNPYLFTGRRYDPEVALFYFRARHYDPSTGRFLQTDPIGYADSMNSYEYAFSNPVNWIDSYGLSGMSSLSALRAAIAIDYGIQEIKKTLVIPGIEGDIMVRVDNSFDYSYEEALYRIKYGYIKDGFIYTPRTNDYEYRIRSELDSLEYKKKYWEREYANRQLEYDLPPDMPMTSLWRGLFRMLLPEFNNPYDTQLATEEITWGIVEIISFASSGCGNEASKALNYSDDLIGFSDEVIHLSDDVIGLVDEGVALGKGSNPTVYLDENIYFMRDHIIRQGYNVRNVPAGMSDDAIRAMVQKENAIFVTRNYPDFKGLQKLIRVSGTVSNQEQMITTLNSLEAARVNPTIWGRMPQIPASGLNSGTLKTATQTSLP